MAILIDGYNFLHVTSVFAKEVGPGSLPKLHSALLEFLARTLDPTDLPHTTIVFDAKGRDAGSRRAMQFGDIKVWYAKRDEEADNLLAELIAADPAPRNLLVVSSDHQVQRAARRRRAKPIDSDVWYADLLRRSRARREKSQAAEHKPPTPLSAADKAWALAQFGGVPLDSEDQDSSVDQAPINPSEPSSTPSKTDPDAIPVPECVDNPFPPSYLKAIEGEFLAGNSDVPPPKPEDKTPRSRRNKRTQ